MNNLIEAFLTSHPDKKRNKEDIDELNGKNKITHDMVSYHNDQCIGII